jgi:hypothetical protein
LRTGALFKLDVLVPLHASDARNEWVAPVDEHAIGSGLLEHLRPVGFEPVNP